MNKIQNSTSTFPLDNNTKKKNLSRNFQNLATQGRLAYSLEVLKREISNL